MTGAPLGRAHGKAILIGEHAVVHGTRAIAMPVGMQVEVELGLERAVGLAPAFLEWFAGIARERSGQAWLPARIGGDLPVGVGLGSSAALGIASLRALGTLAAIGDDELVGLADAGERLFHGNPSGLDVRAVLAGGPIGYRRRPEGLDLAPVDVGGSFLFELWVTPPGPPTAAMVELLAHNLEAGGEREAQLARATGLVEAAAGALAAGDAPLLGAQMQAFHHWLRRLGVSTPILDDLVALAMRSGALGAKLTGGGGGGAMLVLLPGDAADPIELPASVRRFRFRLDAGGVRAGHD